METYYTVILYLLTGLFGLCVGSFLNVVIYRLPNGMSLAYPPSHCTACDYTLRWYDNIPVLSYLLLGGKCRKCKTHISFRYTAVELSNTALWLLSVFLVWERSIPYAVACALASSVFLCIFFIDLSHKIIPDRFQLILLALGVVATVFDPDDAWHVHVIGGIAGFLSFYLLSLLFEKIYGREALGGGDVKLAGVAGLLLGWEKLLLALLVATVPAAVVLSLIKCCRGSKKEKEDDTFPFAPLLVSGFAVAMYFGSQILAWYLSLLGI